MKSFNLLQHINTIFTRDFQYERQVKLFRKVIYIYLIINTLICLTEYSFLWGEYSLINTKNNISFWNLGSVLSEFLLIPLFKNWAWLLIVVQISSLIIGFLGKYRRATAFLVWWSTFNLFNPIHLTITGGEVLIHLLLFYMIFIDENKKGSINTLLNNTFFWACRWQIIFVYLFAAWYKLYDDFWLQGDALYYILQIDAFSRAPVSDYINSNNFLLVIGNYSALLYQLLFPLLIWWKKIKKPFLAIGVLFHISIAFIAGVFSFGIIMIIVYILWLDLKKVDD